MRIISYNVHGCVGLDFQRSEARVAGRIARLEPDIVTLQELDVGRRRSAGRDQASLIATHLNFECEFQPAMRWKNEQYGNAILTRWPMTLRRAGELPSENAFLFRESRAAQWVEIATPAGLLQVINTHLGVGRRERLDQARALMGPDWLGAISAETPALLVGDFNSTPGSTPYSIFAASLDDLVKKHCGRHRRSFPALWPQLALDHVFGNACIQVTNVEQAFNWPDALVSDHLPVVLDFDITSKLIPMGGH